MLNLDKFEENNEVLVNSKLPPSFRNLRDKTCWFEKRINRINRRKDKTLQKKKRCLPGLEVSSWSERACKDGHLPDEREVI